MARIYDDITQTVGNTPLVKIRKMISSEATVLGKLECFNPLASVKDRIGVAMIDAAERDGKISAGTTIITATYVGANGTPSVGATTLTVTSATIDRIQVTPFAYTIPAGFGMMMQATAIYTDGSRMDVSHFATWQSSAPNVAPVSNASGAKGWLLTLSPGTATISARYMGVTGSTTVTVSTAVLTSITVTPDPIELAAGQRAQLQAQGTFDDGNSYDITYFVTWSTSDPSIVDVSNAYGSNGQAAAFQAGAVTVHAQRGTVSGIASLTVR